MPTIAVKTWTEVLPGIGPVGAPITRYHSGGGVGTLPGVGEPSSARLPDWPTIPAKYKEAEKASMVATAGPGRVLPEEGADLLRQYLIATADLGHGQFDELSQARLINIGLIIPQPTISFEEFVANKERFDAQIKRKLAND